MNLKFVDEAFGSFADFSVRKRFATHAAVSLSYSSGFSCVMAKGTASVGCTFDGIIVSTYIGSHWRIARSWRPTTGRGSSGNSWASAGGRSNQAEAWEDSSVSTVSAVSAVGFFLLDGVRGRRYGAPLNGSKLGALT